MQLCYMSYLIAVVLKWRLRSEGCLFPRLLSPHLASSARISSGRHWDARRGGEGVDLLSFRQRGLSSIQICSSCFLLRTIPWRVLSVITGLCAAEVGKLYSTEAYIKKTKPINLRHACSIIAFFCIKTTSPWRLSTQSFFINQWVWLKHFYCWRSKTTPRPRSDKEPLWKHFRAQNILIRVGAEIENEAGFRDICPLIKEHE